MKLSRGPDEPDDAARHSRPVDANPPQITPGDPRPVESKGSSVDSAGVVSNIDGDDLEASPSLPAEVTSWRTRSMAAGAEPEEAPALFAEGEELWRRLTASDGTDLAEFGLSAQDHGALLGSLLKDLGELAATVRPEHKEVIENANDFLQGSLDNGKELTDTLARISPDHPDVSAALERNTASAQDPNSDEPTFNTAEKTTATPDRVELTNDDIEEAAAGGPGDIGPPDLPKAPPGDGADPSPHAEFARWYSKVYPYQVPENADQHLEPAARLRAQFGDYAHPDIRRDFPLTNPAGLAEDGLAEILRQADAILTEVGTTAYSREHPSALRAEVMPELAERSNIEELADKIQEYGPLMISTLHALRNRVMPALVPTDWPNLQTAPKDWLGKQPSASGRPSDVPGSETASAAALNVVDALLSQLEEPPDSSDVLIGSLGEERLTTVGQRRLVGRWADALLGVRQHLAPVRYLASRANQASEVPPLVQESAPLAQNLAIEDLELDSSPMYQELLGRITFIPILVDRCQEPGNLDKAPRLFFVPESISGVRSSSYPSTKHLPILDRDLTEGDQRRLVENGVEWVGGSIAEQLRRGLQSQPTEAEKADNDRSAASTPAKAKDALDKVRQAITGTDSATYSENVWRPLHEYRDSLFTLDLSSHDARQQRVTFNLTNSDAMQVARELLAADRKLEPFARSFRQAWTRREVAHLLVRTVAAAGDQLATDWALFGQLSPDQRSKVSDRVEEYRAIAEETLSRVPGPTGLMAHRGALAVRKLEAMRLESFIRHRLAYLNLAPGSTWPVPSPIPVDEARALRRPYQDAISTWCDRALRTVSLMQEDPSTDQDADGIIRCADQVSEALHGLTADVIPALAPDHADLSPGTRSRAAKDSLDAWDQELETVREHQRHWQRAGSPPEQADEIVSKARDVFSRQRSRQAQVSLEALHHAANGRTPEGLEAAFGAAIRFLSDDALPGTEIPYAVAAHAEYLPVIVQSNIALVPTRHLAVSVDPGAFIAAGAAYWARAMPESSDDSLHQGLRILDLYEQNQGNPDQLPDEIQRIKTSERVSYAVLGSLERLSRLDAEVSQEFLELRTCNDRHFQTNFDQVIDDKEQTGSQDVPPVAERRVDTVLAEPLELAVKLHTALEKMYLASHECGRANAPGVLTVAVLLAAAAGQRLRDHRGTREETHQFVETASGILDRLDELADNDFTELTPHNRMQVRLVAETLEYQRDLFDEGGGSLARRSFSDGPEGPRTSTDRNANELPPGRPAGDSTQSARSGPAGPSVQARLSWACAQTAVSRYMGTSRRVL